MKRLETAGELKKALEKYLGYPLPDRHFTNITEGYYPPYGEGDWQDFLGKLGISSKKVEKKKLPEIIQAITEEITLWQEVLLHELKPELRQIRLRLFHTAHPLDRDQAMAYLREFFDSEKAQVRPAYVYLFLEYPVTEQDFTPYLDSLKPNDREYFLAAAAMVRNRAFLSTTEAMVYILTGQRNLIPGLFNPTMVLLTYRLALYLQPGGRPARSLLSCREKALLKMVGTAPGRIQPTKLWPIWNHRYPQWSYPSWRMFWKAFQRAKKRLLNNYILPFQAEYLQKEDPEHFWEQWIELGKKAQQ